MVLGTVSNLLIFEKFGYGFGNKSLAFAALLFSFYYFKHYNQVNGHNVNFLTYKTDYIYFNDVTEEEKIEIEHKNRIRLLGVDMEKLFFNDFWFGANKTAI